MLHIWGDMRYTNWLMYLMLVLSIFSEAVFPDQEMYLIGRAGGFANFVKGDIRYTDVTEFKFLSIFFVCHGGVGVAKFFKKRSNLEMVQFSSQN